MEGVVTGMAQFFGRGTREGLRLVRVHGTWSDQAGHVA